MSEKTNHKDNVKIFDKMFRDKGLILSDHKKNKLDRNLKEIYEETPVISSFISEDNKIYCKIPMDVKLNFINEKEIKLTNYKIEHHDLGSMLSICVNQIVKKEDGYYLDLISNIVIPCNEKLFSIISPNNIEFNLVNAGLVYKKFNYINNEKTLVDTFKKIYLKHNLTNFYGPLIFLKTQSLQNNNYEGLAKDYRYQLIYGVTKSGIFDDRFYIWDSHDFDFTRKTLNKIGLTDKFLQYCEAYLNQDYQKIIEFFRKLLLDKNSVLLFLKEIDILDKYIEQEKLSKYHDNEKFVTGLCLPDKFISLTLIIFYSDNGQFLPSIDSTSGKIYKTEIDLASIKEFKVGGVESLIDQFWYPFTENVSPFDLHHVYEPNTVLANQFDIEDSMMQGDESKRLFDNISLEGDLDKAIKMVTDIIDEANNNKIWTIPYKAKVQIQFGNFQSLVISEYKNKIHFLLYNSNYLSFYGNLDIDKKKWNIGMLDHLPDDFNGDSDIRIRVALQLLIASIIRDFWVVEVRESIFDYSKKRIKLKIAGEKIIKETVKYIPRIKYVRKMLTHNVETGLNYTERRAHWVVAHLRKIQGKPSNTAVALAKNYNFEIKENYTFVKPHERGSLKGKNVMYRSKSALKLLFQENITVSPGSETPEWFKFELDVNKWLIKNKFETIHTGGSGDGGKDIIATKIIDKEIQTFLFECKCWKPPVGIGIVRNLVGTLTDYPPGTIGAIITTSNFTSDAIEYAEKKDIMLIDGQQLLNLNFLN